MAKKKRKRGGGSPKKGAPKGPPPKGAPQQGAQAATPAGAVDAAAAKAERREAAKRRREKELRREKARRIVIGALILILIVAVFGGRWYMNQRAAAAYQELAETAGCGEVRDVGGLENEPHWQPGQQPPTYETQPPAGGLHTQAVLPQGVYQEPLATDITANGSIYNAVHSLEHGYVIVWHDGLENEEILEIEGAARGESEVIVVPYPDMPDGSSVAYTVWGKLQHCDEASAEVTTAFIDRFKNKFGPEASAS